MKVCDLVYRRLCNDASGVQLCLHPLCLCLKLTAHAQGAKVTALSSVVAGKEVESEVIAIRRELEGDIFSSMGDIFSLSLSLFLSLALSHLHSFHPTELFQSN